jgi:hypothetical protein
VQTWDVTIATEQPLPDVTPEECWNLDFTVAQLLLPRLVRFREASDRVPDGLDRDEWRRCLDGMVDGFAEVVADKGADTDEEVVRRGVILFARFYRELWY